MQKPRFTDLWPNPLSDESAYAVSETLYRLAMAFDECYGAQIHRHIERQIALDAGWQDFDPDADPSDFDDHRPPF